MLGKTRNAGQTCIAPDYVLVPRNVRETFAEGCRAAVAKMFPTIEKNADYTAIVNDAHYARIRGIIDDAKTRGGRIVEINPVADALPAESRKIAPTLILDPTDEMLCQKEEIFGPVLPVIAYDRLDEAIDYVNARPRPLALYYFGYNRDVIDQVVSRTMSGGVTINDTMLHFVQEDLPFGGVGASGMGQYHGRDGFLTFSKKRPVFHQARVSASGLLRPPYGKMADQLLRFVLKA
jgi:coniferyl-aldehyde dehydrogenase